MSGMGGGSTTNSSQQGTSNTDYSGQTYSGSILPDWVNQAGPDLYNQGVNEYNNFNPLNPLVQQGMGLAEYMGGFGGPGFDNAASWYGNDRGGSYATTALDRILAMTGGGAGAGGNVSTNPRTGIRDVNYRNFTDYDVGAYMNPYTQQVVDTSLGDLDRQAQIEGLRRQSAQTAAGAFGGARHGIADALASGENARAAGTLSAQLRSAAYDNATNLIGRDQAGDLSAQQGNQGADVSAAQIAAQENAANQASASQLQGNQLQSLASALTGGLNLGQLDLARGGAWQNLGESSYGILSGAGNNLAQLQGMPFQMLQGLAGMLSGIPTEQGQFGTTSGSSSTQSTMSGRERTREQPGMNDYLGTALTLMGLM